MKVSNILLDESLNANEKLNLIKVVSLNIESDEDCNSIRELSCRYSIQRDALASILKKIKLETTASQSAFYKLVGCVNHFSQPKELLNRIGSSDKAQHYCSGDWDSHAHITILQDLLVSDFPYSHKAKKYPLNKNERVLLAILYVLSSNYFVVRDIPNKYLALLLGCKIGSIRPLVNRLIRKGFIRCLIAGGSSKSLGLVASTYLLQSDVFGIKNSRVFQCRNSFSYLNLMSALGLMHENKWASPEGASYEEMVNTLMDKKSHKLFGDGFKLDCKEPTDFAYSTSELRPILSTVAKLNTVILQEYVRAFDKIKPKTELAKGVFDCVLQRVFGSETIRPFQYLLALCCLHHLLKHNGWVDMVRANVLENIIPSKDCDSAGDDSKPNKDADSSNGGSDKDAELANTKKGDKQTNNKPLAIPDAKLWPRIQHIEYFMSVADLRVQTKCEETILFSLTSEQTLSE
ncbi:hypothetical protein DS2_14629 [Catenovulum agarivorans DS-2]|uniref:Uncharacterized protein n=1 Tax=Catenovulum agarivorans DS-2 TaxID=1328313 RepID=W7QLL3_9ALTE|nr:hypothetical protein [Catenovulum agarivorans]EWH09018.1 hypothetical protein DS2_14629 [Catenovulum agarivorans DS-2]